MQVKWHILNWVVVSCFFVMLDHLSRMVNELVGNLVGHLYFFLMFKYPMDLGGRAFLNVPEFL